MAGRLDSAAIDNGLPSVPPIIVQKIFTQIFSYINVQLFNSLLLRRECCTFSNGEYVKAGIAELELWCCQAKEEIRLGESTPKEGSNPLALDSVKGDTNDDIQCICPENWIVKAYP
ncbi:hypothetical protein RJ640_023359 [Escallonia rubra]|uniref:Dilute domain-containing protein n=1 Tax=Escallonia rubra TaxID=112253 RepID=A0AA88R5V2_9ASTE|nr:hypothetical protein RJ640_023359 [Escallonia rubra]